MKTSPLSERFKEKISEIFLMKGVEIVHTESGIRVDRKTLMDNFYKFIESELLSIRDEVEGRRVEHIDSSDQSQWGEQYTRDEHLRTRQFNAGLDTTLSIINTHLYGEKE